MEVVRNLNPDYLQGIAKAEAQLWNRVYSCAVNEVAGRLRPVMYDRVLNAAFLEVRASLFREQGDFEESQRLEGLAIFIERGRI